MNPVSGTVTVLSLIGVEEEPLPAQFVAEEPLNNLRPTAPLPQVRPRIIRSQLRVDLPRDRGITSVSQSPGFSRPVVRRWASI